jgi:hypothetical protein
MMVLPIRNGFHRLFFFLHHHIDERMRQIKLHHTPHPILKWSLLSSARVHAAGSLVSAGFFEFCIFTPLFGKPKGDTIKSFRYKSETKNCSLDDTSGAIYLLLKDGFVFRFDGYFWDWDIAPSQTPITTMRLPPRNRTVTCSSSSQAATTMVATGISSVEYEVAEAVHLLSTYRKL